MSGLGVGLPELCGVTGAQARRAPWHRLPGEAGLPLQAAAFCGAGQLCGLLLRSQSEVSCERGQGLLHWLRMTGSA